MEWYLIKHKDKLNFLRFIEVFLICVRPKSGT
jgi:hypothetical protein